MVRLEGAGFQEAYLKVKLNGEGPISDVLNEQSFSQIKTSQRCISLQTGPQNLKNSHIFLETVCMERTDLNLGEPPSR